jgi:hypothetical protein
MRRHNCSHQCSASNACSIDIAAADALIMSRARRAALPMGAEVITAVANSADTHSQRSESSKVELRIQKARIGAG